ncbi:Nn.00g064700.m01.CDS01 [Neocucurbitaria sp. VM-36]
MGDSLKTPHSVSLKVLRLSRPSLATQYPLPNPTNLGISPKASLAYPPQNATDDKFILSSVLNLPEAFGSAYVGETFSCTLCANNELNSLDTTKTISGVRIQGDMQTPSNPAGSPLDLAGSSDEGGTTYSPGPGESLQRILRFELKEEGNHVLAVTVTYTETALGEGKAASGRVRTFRKLYQFVAQQLLSVRTKAGEISQKDGSSKYLLEAQLENMGEAAVCLEAVNVNPKPPLKSTSLNWDMHPLGLGQHNNPILSPRDVIQVAFLLDEHPGIEEGLEASAAGDSKRVLGQLAIQWRSALGDRGSLSTGWLTARR